MSLKLPKIFIIPIIMLLIPNLVFAQQMTDDQVMAKYASPNALQDAINNCQVDYNNLPNDSIKTSVKPNPPSCQQVSSLDQLSSSSVGSGVAKKISDMTNMMTLLPIIFILIIIPVFLIPRLLGHFHEDDDSYDSNTSGGRHKKIKIHIIHKILLTIGILKIKRPEGKQDLDKVERKKSNKTLPKGFGEDK